MIAVLLLILVVSFVLFVLACYKTDRKTIDEQNRQYYIDGYHIYYDRKILRQKEVEQLKSKLE
mgnify:CR=1 FL=1|jgi:hypothetical protein